MDSADHDFVTRFRAGDPLAFERFVKRWDTDVLNLAYRLMGDLEEAKDIRQLAFLRVYTTLPSFEGRARISTWLYRIVVNICRDQLRSRQSRRRLLEIDSQQRGAGGAHPSPAEEHEHNELGQVVARAVRALPQAEREVVVLRHYQQLPFPKIATILGTPVTTVRSRMRRGLGRLRDQLQDVQVCTNP